MRAQAKQAPREEEEESAFVSMTDMTVGFLFIMMILLAFFASQITDTETVPLPEYQRLVAERDAWRQLAEDRAATVTRLETELRQRVTERDALRVQVAALEAERDALVLQVEQLRIDLVAAQDRIEDLTRLVAELQAELRNKEAEIAQLREELQRLQAVDPLEAYLARVSQTRREVLTRLRDAIRADFPDLQVELSEESDALRFQGEGLFASGRSTLTPAKRDIVARLAQRLDEVLPCFTIGQSSTFSETCNPGFVMIEAVQIEGHTDTVGTDSVNRTLSAARANTTYFAMTDAAERVVQHLNLKKQPVLSVAAYGPDRPVATNDTLEGRSTNRRIDLRFIMVTPQDTSGIEVIRAALGSPGSE